ncbi:MAG: hydroxymethylbilane synthase [Bacillota bacterium]
MKREIVIGSRDSALALWQTQWVLEALEQMHPEYRFRVEKIKTQGDKILDVALAKIGDKGLFTKELELAMQEGDIDLAVHSMKDLPTQLPAGLTVGAVCLREVPNDVVISHKGYTLDTMPIGAKVGTSSLRRRAQLLQYRPDLDILDIRGNLNTRMAKMEREDMDGIILAAAGVVRMGWADKIVQRIPFDICLPAVGQGSIGVEIREENTEVQELVSALNHRDSAMAITAERALLRQLEGGCQIPIGALGRVEGEHLHLDGLVASLNGRRVIRASLQGPVKHAADIGRRLAADLKGMGAAEILAEVRQETKAYGK